MSAGPPPETMTHEQASAELAGAALDALPERERALVLAHAATCSECGPELRALASVASALAEAFEPAPGERLDAPHRDALRARILARVADSRRGDADSAGTPAGPRLVRDASSPPPRQAVPARREPRRFGPASWMALAASVAFLAAAAGLARIASDRDALRRKVSALSAQRASADTDRQRLRAELEERDRLLAQLTGPSVRVVEMVSAGPRAPSGRMFWDQAANAWTFVAHDLPAPSPGRTYQLWVIARRGGSLAYVSAGTFTPRPDGSAIVRATYPLPPNELAAIGVTDEPAGGVPQPTGRLVISGNASD